MKKIFVTHPIIGHDRLIERSRAFYELAQPGDALVQVKSIRELTPPALKPLNEWNLDEGLTEYLDALIERELAYWQHREALRDDLLPSIAPFYGIAELTAYLGGAVTMQRDTSYHHQVLKHPAERPDTPPPEANAWHRRVIGGMHYLREKLDGRLFVRLRGASGPIDMANALRGNDVFYDLYDEPEALDDLMSWCAGQLARWLEEQLKAADSVGGGLINGFGIWMPPRCVGHLSEDASVLCSPEAYKVQCRKHTERALNGFGGAFIHTHSAGWHAIADIAGIQKLKMIEISNDPNAPRGIQVLRQLEPALTGKIIVLSVTPDEVRANIDLLSRHPVILWLAADTLAEAQAMVCLVRGLLPPVAG